LGPSSLLVFPILVTTDLNHLFLLFSLHVVIRTRLVSRLLLKYLYTALNLFYKILSMLKYHLYLFNTFFALRGRNRRGDKIASVVS
jgi:hypothetical protein